LLCLDQIAPSDNTINIAIECGNQLVASGTSMESGIGWINPANKERPLVGFSHGTTSISWALLKLADRTNNNHHFTTTGWLGNYYGPSNKRHQISFFVNDTSSDYQFCVV
jgi:lantibiotic modifying enzyme